MAPTTTTTKPAPTEGIALSLPALETEARARFEALISSKRTLITKALDADNLNVEDDGQGHMSLPWLKVGADPADVTAAMDLATAMSKAAKEATRVSAKETPVDNEKYAFRCFLLRLGFIGEETKASRRQLLKRLEGNTAFKTPPAKTEATKPAKPTVQRAEKKTTTAKAPAGKKSTAAKTKARTSAKTQPKAAKQAGAKKRTAKAAKTTAAVKEAQ